MKKDTFVPLSVIFILFVSLVIIPVSAAQTTTVSPGDDIAAAIASIDDGGTIFFEAGTYDVNIVIDDPGKSFSLVGAGQGSTFLDGNDADSVIKILNSDPHTITVKGFTIQNGSYGTQNVGGGIHTNNSIIRVQDCTITNNTTINGGGMYIQYSAGEITNCSFTGNLADGGSGGAIYNWGASPDITNCTFNSNVADSNEFGGAIYNHNSSSPTITDCTFISNITNGSGGAIGNNIESSPTIVSCTFTENEGAFAGAIGNRYGSESFISDCTFYENMADIYGGAIYNLTDSDEDPDQPVITNCTFVENGDIDNLSYGGAIANNNSAPEIVDCTFMNNQAVHGGTIFNTKSSPLITGCTFSGNLAHDSAGIRSENNSDIVVSYCIFDSNKANTHGGAMFSVSNTRIAVSNCVFSYNEAESGNGAGMYNQELDFLAVDNCEFYGNIANKISGYGGAIYNDDCHDFSTVHTIEECTFSFNEAYRGGAIHNDDSSPLIGNCTFTDNSALYSGAIYNNRSSPSITKCIFRDNKATYGSALNSMTADVSPQVITITNCIFNGNESGFQGGAIYAGYKISTYLTNCTFSDNLSGNDRGVIYNAGDSLLFITNCILWNNGIEIYDIATSPAIVTYSDVRGGWPGEGNIDADPLFISPPSDLSLRQSSPCIDTGTDAGVTDDIIGTPRPQRAGYDMGAYEYAGSSWSPVSIMPLARTQLANVSDAWGELSAQLPEEPTNEMTSLVEGIQEHMQNATGLANPVYASGELARALALMDELSTLL